MIDDDTSHRGNDRSLSRMTDLPRQVVIDAETLADWIRERSRGHERLLFGLAGAPGSGKSTLARRIADALDAPLVPMDGFHLPDATLVERGLRSVKGAPHTFDSDGFVAAVRLLRAGDDVSLPTFDRATDEPVPDSLHVGRAASVVIVEGNYLLLETPPWAELASIFDAVAHLHLQADVRVERLIERHIAHGKRRDEARHFVETSDEVNAAQVEAVRHRADLIVSGT
ncbi:MAG: nucleoside/nucleotide kinase family protein [Ilumatobacter sp.]